MKNYLKRILSLVLFASLMLSSIPCTNAFAASGTDATIQIGEVSAVPGSTVQVDISMVDNPGVYSVEFQVGFDPEYMTLTNVKYNDAFGGSGMAPPLGSSFSISWYNNLEVSDVYTNGVLATLTFNVNENAPDGTQIEIAIVPGSQECYNASDAEVPFAFVNGIVTVRKAVPGDINGDRKVTTRDVTRLHQYVVGWDVAVDTKAVDVNGDGKVTTRDVTRLHQYVVGWDVEVFYDGMSNICDHTLQATVAKAPTCTEKGNIAYWSCSKCEKYFSDEVGKTEIAFEDTVIPAHTLTYMAAVPATTEKEGCIEHWKCFDCNKYFGDSEGTKELTENEVVIQPLAPDESNISYRHYVRKENSNGTVEIVYDEYLDTHGINNPNPVIYVEGTGVAELIEGVPINDKKVSANGYSFLGWYEKPEATAKRVYSISTEETGNKVLYGVWSKDVYTITYLPDSASSILPRVEDDTYSIDKETSLSEPPQWPNLVWIGWSDEDGKIVKSIPKGTTGNITLTANWMSRRSQTVPNTKYASSKPAIAIDEEAGIYAFTYEIGDIQNVPIQQIESGVDGKGFNLLKGQTHEINQTFTQKIEQGEATSVADTIANATTKSDSWTLSEDWNKSSTFSEEHSNEVSQEQSQKASISFTETEKYSLSSGIGGSKEHIDESGSSTKTTSKNDFGVSVNAGVKADIKAGVTAATPFKNASVEANVGLDYRYSKETEEETHETHTDKTSSYWNVDSGFEKSESLSTEAEFSSSLRQSIQDTYGYSETLDFGGSSSNTVSSSNTSSQSREYASSVTYSTEEGKSYTVVETLTADAETGYYRKVLAANFKVFAVVIYDMKSNTFSTMTYSLKIKDSEHLFTDYSTVSSFNDYENGVLPFEVPYFVSDYVYGLVGASEGVKVDDETGIVESYGFKDPATGICYKKYDEYTDTYSEPCDTDVIIPRYVVVTVSNNQKKIVPVTGISASAFSGSTVTSVYLSDKITEIPAGAFENCTSLKYVRGGTIDTIGANAFKNCTSLFEFVLPDIVTNLGDSAFMNVDALTVNVANPAVLDAALNSGVKALTVDLATMSGSVDGKKIVTPATMEYFSISGGGKVYNKVSVDSGANTVVLNNMTINNYVDVPLKFTGANLELGFVTINAGGLIMRLDADTTYVTLDGNNYLVSSGENAVLSKNIRFLEKEGSSATGKLRVTGNILVYGTANGVQRVSFDSAAYNFVYLTEEEYTNMLNSHYVHFDANGGTVDTESKLIMWNSRIGELPIPVRTDCTFLGWYKADGTQLTADTVFTELDDITVKAHWETNWVKASDMPSGASATETKWTYDLITQTTSDSATAPEGFSAYKDPTWVWGEYGSWSSWSKTEATASDSREVETRNIAAKTKTQYNYHRYLDSSYYWTSHSKGTFSGYYCHIYQETGWLDYALTWKETVDGSHNRYGTYNGSDYWYDPQTRTVTVTPAYIEYRYRDRSKVYTYYYQKIEAKESVAEISASSTVSNVQKWVKYVIN